MPAATSRRRKAVQPRPPPKRPGVSYKPSDKDRRTVEAMASGRLGQDEICAVLGITGKTLRKHFEHELRTAFIRAKDSMWRSLFNQGVGSPARVDENGQLVSPPIPPNVKATIAWLQFQAGASDRTEGDRGVMPVVVTTTSPVEAARRIAFALMAGMTEPKIIDVEESA